ncbi:MAG: substrate-binding domain-containing protein [Micrococcales bacterium]
MSRILRATVVALAAAISLTACTPPMPPEVLAALAEQTYTCEAGEVKVWAIDSVATVATDWQSSSSMNCPEMPITPTPTVAADVQLQITSGQPTGTAFASVPMAVDAVAFAYNLDGVSGLNLDAATLEKIYAGQITNWSDPAIAKQNPGFTLPSVAISFGSELDATKSAVMTSWLSRLAGHPVSLPAGSATIATPGAIILTTYSKATTNSLTMAGIITGKKLESDFAVADTNGLLTAASQWKTTNTSSGISVELAPNSKPLTPLGLDVAPNPYQAVFPVNLYLVGPDSLNTRAAARYLLRQDSQGSLALSSVVALPENIRVVSLTSVSKGLPTPTQSPAGN